MIFYLIIALFVAFGYWYWAFVIDIGSAQKDKLSIKDFIGGTIVCILLGLSWPFLFILLCIASFYKYILK